MKDILSEIIAHKQTEIELQKQTVSLEQLQEQAGVIIRENAAHRRSMKQALAASSTGIISEFKRRSPSKGWINEAAQAEEIPASYEAAGAAALSILTDEKFFGGTLRDIRTARPLVRIPILRKDFIIDEYQLLQACRRRTAHCRLPQSGAVQHPHHPSPRTRAGGIARNPQPFGTLLYK